MPPPPTIGGSGIMLSGCRPFVRPFTSISRRRDICLLTEGISMHLATNNHHVSGRCWKGFEGHRSKVKVICV